MTSNDEKNSYWKVWKHRSMTNWSIRDDRSMKNVERRNRVTKHRVEPKDELNERLTKSQNDCSTMKMLDEVETFRWTRKFQWEFHLANFRGTFLKKKFGTPRQINTRRKRRDKTNIRFEIRRKKRFFYNKSKNKNKIEEWPVEIRLNFFISGRLSDVENCV